MSSYEKETLKKIVSKNDNVKLDFAPFQLPGADHLSLKLEVDDDKIVGCQPQIGYLHRGIEKILENKRYQESFPAIVRIDSKNGELNSLGFALAVEKLIELEIPERGQWLRTLISEIHRIYSHLAWLRDALGLLDLSHVIKVDIDLELTMQTLAAISARSVNSTFFRIGGVSGEPGKSFLDKLGTMIENHRDSIKNYKSMILEDPFFCTRTCGLGAITIEDALDFSLTGPVLRACGVEFDLRRIESYCKYSEIDFEIPTGDQGDVYDRFLVRIEEIDQSLNIIEQCLEEMSATGPLNVGSGKYIAPPRDQMQTTIEGMIQHFKLAADGFSPPAGKVHSRIESSRGEAGCFIVSREENKPYRCRLRMPGFFTLQALERFVEGEKVSDLPLIYSSLDIAIGEVDR